MMFSQRSRTVIELTALVIAFVVGGFVVWLAFDLEHQGNLLGKNGISAQGTVVEKWARAEGGSSPYYGRPEMSPRYWIKFGFSDMEGEAHVQEKTVPFFTYGKLTEGQRIEVRYLAKDPRVSEIVTGRVAKSSLTLKIFGFAILAFSLFAGWAWVAKRLRYNQSGT